jgi:hypothetical protein
MLHVSPVMLLTAASYKDAIQVASDNTEAKAPEAKALRDLTVELTAKLPGR